MGVNRVTLVGFLGRDPELRMLTSGPTAAFSVATDEVFTNRTSGERQTRTEWHNIVVYGKLAELCGDYLKKGRQVYIEGRIHTRSYDKDRSKVRVTEIVANVVQFLGSKGEKAPGIDGVKVATLDEAMPDVDIPEDNEF